MSWFTRAFVIAFVLFFGFVTLVLWLNMSQVSLVPRDANAQAELAAVPFAEMQQALQSQVRTSMRTAEEYAQAARLWRDRANRMDAAVAAVREQHPAVAAAWGGIKPSVIALGAPAPKSFSEVWPDGSITPSESAGRYRQEFAAAAMEANHGMLALATALRAATGATVATTHARVKRLQDFNAFAMGAVLLLLVMLMILVVRNSGTEESAANVSQRDLETSAAATANSLRSSPEEAREAFEAQMELPLRMAQAKVSATAEAPTAGAASAGVASAGVTTAGVATAEVATAGVANAGAANAGAANAGAANAEAANAEAANAEAASAEAASAGLVAAELAAAEFAAAGLEAAELAAAEFVAAERIAAEPITDSVAAHPVAAGVVAAEGVAADGVGIEAVRAAVVSADAPTPIGLPAPIDVQAAPAMAAASAPPTRSADPIDATQPIVKVRVSAYDVGDIAKGPAWVIAESASALAARIGTDFSKDIRVIARGLDRLPVDLVTKMQDVVLQLVRNAAVHGIEAPAHRTACGKHPQGTINIEVRADPQARTWELSVEDDGRGISRERLRAAAVRKGMMSAEQAQALDGVKLIALLFRPGFTTAEEVTAHAGRGLGMDIVKSTVEELGGRIGVATKAGRFMRLRISLPMSLADEAAA